MKPNIEIYIDKIVLHGYDRKQGRLIGEALEQQLQTILMEKGLSKDFVQNAQISHIDGGPLTINSGQQPQQIGRGLADSVYQSINSKQ